LEAIKLEYEKDLEYNYSHIATLSGGMDSRMNVMNAKKLGYSDILCVCFSQSTYLDEVIAKKIASDQGFDFIFHSLDNGNYLKNIDEAVFVNDGLSLYPGSMAMQSTLKLIDSTKFGLLHTGLLWLSPWNQGISVHTSVNSDDIKAIAYSRILLDEKMIHDLVIPQNYENEELFSLYERGTNCQFNGYRIIEQFTEFSSPLHDKDFLEYAIRVPPQKNNSLYIKWMLSEVPEAAEFRWEQTGVKINAGFLKKLGYRMYRFIVKKHLRKNKINKDAMNPEDYWYHTNPGLKKVIDSYYTKNIGLLSKHPALMNDAQRLFAEGVVREKAQVLTLLAAMKLHSLHD
jgi:asparagine synthase (glutamine-hydrolysing)